MKYCYGIITTILLVTLALTGTGHAESEFFDGFRNNYDRLLTDLSRKPPAEVAEVNDFVYQKDVLTVTFTRGRIYFLRTILDRPTTALFIGEGNARMMVPVPTERQSLLTCSKDSTIDEDFTVCTIRMSDDFDLKLRSRFTFEETTLPWRDFNKAPQGEFFFRPVVMHEYDNLFQLLRSAYERKEDGYFWIDFNRYVFCYDPNRPEQVVMGYEHEGGDLVATDGAVLQRIERGINDDDQVSDIVFPTTVVGRQADLRMAGLDGKVIDAATADLNLRVNADSLRFVSLFLHSNFKLDSIQYEGLPVDYSRRGSFSFVGVILPSYAHKGDTLHLRLWYHGSKFGSALPFVADPTPAALGLRFNIPKGYNYLMPAMSKITDVGGGRIEFEATPSQPYTNFHFQPYASGFDTIPEISDMGLTVNFIKSKHITKNRYECFIPDDQYRSTVMGAFNYMTGRLGMPPATFAMFVFPDSSLTMPGLMEVPQVQCVMDETGGLHMAAGSAAARQWFGSLASPATDREYWLLEAVPDYLSLMYVGNSVGHPVFFGELARRRNHIYTVIENKNDLPLASGRRVSSDLRTSKGAWVFHMLRYLMYDLEKRSDRTFQLFIRDLSVLINSQTFTNVDVIELAEKSYGAPLDWFFDHWLYRRNIPEYQVEYSTVQKSDGFYVDVDVRTEGVAPEFQMPVIMRVEDESGRFTYHRQTVSGLSDQITLGPFAAEPKELIFNEYYSVLCKSKVDRN